MSISALDVFKKETEKAGVAFLNNYGLRFFFPSGEVTALSTCFVWNEFLENEVDKHYERLHYENELSASNLTNSYYLIRTPDNIHSSYLKKLHELGMSNSLVIYRRLHQMIVGYYFIPHRNDHQAFLYFINNLSLFENIARRVGKIIDCKKYYNKSVEFSQKYKLIDPSIAGRLIFNKSDIAKRVNNCGFTVHGRDYNFTPKEIANYFNDNKKSPDQKDVSCRTIEWHISNIKKKAGLSSSIDLRDFAIEVCNLI